MIREKIIYSLRGLIMDSARPSEALTALKSEGKLDYLPELTAMAATPQDPGWHPEGTVWDHTMLVIDEAAAMKIALPEHRQLPFMFAALLHDVGKPYTTFYSDGRLRSPMHDQVGETITRALLPAAGFDNEDTDFAALLVRNHLRPMSFWKNASNTRPSTIRRLASEIDVPALLLLARADHYGRATADAICRSHPAADWLEEYYNNVMLADGLLLPLLSGRDLLLLGLNPGPAIGDILLRCRTMQLAGRLASRSEAMEWVNQFLAARQ